MVVRDRDDFFTFLVFVPRIPDTIPPFLATVLVPSPWSMLVEVLRCRKMPHTGDERLPERPVIGPLGKDFVDGRVMDSWVAIRVFRHGQTLPLHPGVEHPQNEIKDAMIAQFALWTALGHREVR